MLAYVRGGFGSTAGVRASTYWARRVPTQSLPGIGGGVPFLGANEARTFNGFTRSWARGRAWRDGQCGLWEAIGGQRTSRTRTTSSSMRGARHRALNRAFQPASQLRQGQGLVHLFLTLDEAVRNARLSESTATVVGSRAETRGLKCSRTKEGGRHECFKAQSCRRTVCDYVLANSELEAGEGQGRGPVGNRRY